MSRTIQLTFDCADPNALAGFWAEVLGYRYDSPPPGFETWDEALATAMQPHSGPTFLDFPMDLLFGQATATAP